MKRHFVEEILKPDFFIDKIMSGKGSKMSNTSKAIAKSRRITEWKDKRAENIAKPARGFNKKLDKELFDGPNWKCLTAVQASTGQFSGSRFLGMFHLENIHMADDPEEVLKQLFKMCFEEAKKGAEQRKLTPDQYLFALDSPLLDWDIRGRYHQLNDNTINSLMHKFEKINQSNKLKDSGRDSLTTAPFTIDITSFQTRGKAPKNFKKHRGGCGKKKLRPLFQNINTGALININNSDHFCLFRSILMAKAKNTMTTQAFRNYKNSDVKQQSDLDKMLNEIDINKQQDSYSIEEFGPIIQRYLDEKWPETYKIFAFKEHGFLKPFWQSDVDDRQFTTALSIYFHEEEEHFDAIDNVGHLFGKIDENGHLRGKYCFSCEMPYDRSSDHKTICRSKCLNCQAVGPEYPCKADGFFKFCDDCCKTFRNNECWIRHLVKKQRKGKDLKSVCQKSKKCNECGIVYSVKTNTKNKRTGHKCGEKWCTKCRKMHIPGRCYINPNPNLFLPIQKKEKRYVYFDLEATTNYKPDPSLMRFLHQTNFAAAYVLCTRCMKDDKWKKPLEEPCEICGPYRSYAFTALDFEGTPEIEKVYKHPEPVKALTQWFLYFEQNLAEEEKEEEEVHRDMGLIEGDEDENEPPKKKKKMDKKEVKKRPSFQTIAYAHAGSRYDNFMVFAEIIRLGLPPTMIRNGNRLYEMKVHKPGHITSTVFRDSYNLIPIKLSKFVETFGLDIEQKMHFPYAFNVEENYNVFLDHLPDIKYYGPNSMLPEDKIKLEKWHQQNRKQKFSLNEALPEYCFNDVKNLLYGMMTMIELFKRITAIDITEYVTIASVCVEYFMSGIRENWLALTPHLGYEKRDKQSTAARIFLKWLSEFLGVSIQHVENGGEKNYRNYKLDGFIERQPWERDLAIEINGCYWHGCKKHYKDDNQKLGGGKSAGKLRELTAQKRKDIEEEMDYEEFWECEIKEMLEISKKMQMKEEREKRKKKEIDDDEMDEENDSFDESMDFEFEQSHVDEEEDDENQTEEEKRRKKWPVNSRMAKFFEECKVSGPLDYHEAFFGGRVGPECLFSTTIGKPGKKIGFRDVNSLYPKTNFYENYPISHPEVCIYDKPVNWTKPDDMCRDDAKKTPIFGLIKCDVVPPLHPKLGIPVLPMRINNRLHFSLCLKCSNKFKDGGQQIDNYSCNHYEDKDRQFTTTIPHIELAKALEAGYRVTYLYRTYEWPFVCDQNEDLFKKYVRKFLKIKYEASGWPPECLDESISEEEREERKKKYISDAYERYEIELDRDNISYNPGLRYIAKLCLNSLWGRFALRNKLAQTVIVDSNAALAKILNDNRIDIVDHEQLSESTYMVVIKSKDEHVVENKSSNPIIALWTTSSARIHLLEGIYKILEGRPDAKILYMDTDSLIYEYDESLGDPMAELSGEHLGQWKEEYPDFNIIEFVSGGSKSYSLWMKNKKTEEDKFVMRMKGITLDCRTQEKLTYEKFKERCLNFGKENNFEIVSYPDKNFRRDKTGKIWTVPMEKKVQPFVSKGNVDKNYNVIPFGLVNPKFCKKENCSCKNGF